MRFLCDNYSYGILDEPGDQPIRIFFPKLQSEFKRINDELKQTFEKLPDIHFSFLTENIRPFGPSCTLTKIEIHDTFLSVLWGVTFGVLTKAPIRHDKSDEEQKAASDLLDYSLDLLTEYKEWDKQNLLNPELHQNDPKQLIDKSNLIFWFASIFIIYHEFAHIILGHFNPTNKLSKLEKEYEADVFAMTQIMKKYKGTFQESSAQLGIISSLATILFCTYDSSGGNIHPDPHHRLTKVIEKLDHSKNKDLYGVAMWFIIDWGMNFNAYFKLWPGKYSGSMKEAYMQTLFYLNNLQKERDVIIPDLEKDYAEGEEVMLLDNGVLVTIIRKVKIRSKHFNIYKIKFESGYTNFVSSDDVARKGSEIELLVADWKQEMKEAGEKSLSVAIDRNNELHCFLHTSEHYRLIKKYHKLKFKYAWGQPSY